MTKKLYFVMAILLAMSLLLAACAPAATPEPTPPPAAQPTTPPAQPTTPPAQPTTPPADTPVTPPTTEAIKACQVTDVGGIDDRSFNATAWEGVLRAQQELGAEGLFLESQQQVDYERNINAFVEEDCDIIVTVGFLLGEATANAAQTYPDQNFAIVDFAYDPTIPNVLGLIFDTDEAAFLAGYAAAGMTQTGVVGTFGGLQIPPVTVFMDGFVLGVQYYNEQHGTNVRAEGWNPATQTGLFTGNFESTDDGRDRGEALMELGADIIMPVAGPVGLGTAAAVREHGNAYIIGVDTDWTISASEYSDVILTSVMKNMDVAVFNAIQQVQAGTFQGGVFLGTLENDGVGLAPFHQFENMVPAKLLSELDQIRADIIAGNIQTSP
jgi:basic membrane protein A and related proteins